MAVTPPDLSLAQLRCFLAIVDAGSFAAAGRRLGLATPVVSKTIARLEAAHGVKLLHRSTHATSPTAEGEALVAPARAALHAMGEAARTLGARRDADGGWVRLTAPVALLRHCLVPLLPALARELPALRLDLRSSNERLDLADHGIDLAIRTGPLDDVPGHVRQPWFVSPWVVCAAPAYLAGRTVPDTPEALHGHRLIGFRASDDGLVRHWRFRAPDTGAAQRLTPDPQLVFDDGEAGWRAARDGVGIACAPLFLAAEALRAGEMVELLRGWRDTATAVTLLRRDTRLTLPRVEQLIGFLRRHTPALDV
ncbi:LysR family transcriptional regulator [Sphingomonas sp. BK235]|uniref:LysR family transcriptional regulator n=1 Tax=Sphingomonas sp. BK235 TaxID=2512131 RepID=UPI00104CF1CC|nr:LysR family transcriptional regulator [Sphingomonas sp. BK235]TCP31875.1 DNA-binding transcriptional LysR family regulator [Sphingomonas sp. BK235]